MSFYNSRLSFVLGLMLSFLVLGGCSSAQKQRLEMREKMSASSGFYCEFISGDIHNDIDVELNMVMAKRCDAAKPFSLTIYKNSSENYGVIYCCSIAKKSDDKKVETRSFGPGHHAGSEDLDEDTPPSSPKPTDIKPTDVKPTDVKPTDVKPTDKMDSKKPETSSSKPAASSAPSAKAAPAASSASKPAASSGGSTSSSKPATSSAGSSSASSPSSSSPSSSSPSASSTPSSTASNPSTSASKPTTTPQNTGAKPSAKPQVNDDGILSD